MSRSTCGAQWRKVRVAGRGRRFVAPSGSGHIFVCAELFPASRDPMVYIQTTFAMPEFGFLVESGMVPCAGSVLYRLLCLPDVYAGEH